MAQQAGWVSAAQKARRACSSCPGVQPAGEAGLSFQQGVEIAKNSTNESPSIEAAKGSPCPIAPSAADHYANLVGGWCRVECGMQEARQRAQAALAHRQGPFPAPSPQTKPEQAALDQTSLERAMLWNITELAKQPVAPVNLSAAAAANATLISQFGDVALALHNYTAIVPAATNANATMQARI